MTEPHIRLMTKEDVPGVHALECASHQDPWGTQTFYASLEVGFQGLVLTLSEEIAGYVLFSTVVDECHILNFGVMPKYRRHGYAKRLLGTLVHLSSDLGIRKIMLEVSVANQAALALYAGFGFQTEGLRKEYYDTPQGKEDAYAMTLYLPENEKNHDE